MSGLKGFLASAEPTALAEPPMAEAMSPYEIVLPAGSCDGRGALWCEPALPIQSASLLSGPHILNRIVHLPLEGREPALGRQIAIGRAGENRRWVAQLCATERRARCAHSRRPDLGHRVKSLEAGIGKKQVERRPVGAKTKEWDGTKGGSTQAQNTHIQRSWSRCVTRVLPNASPHPQLSALPCKIHKAANMRKVQSRPRLTTQKKKEKELHEGQFKAL